MESGTPAEGAPTPNESAGSERDDLVTSLREWLAVLDDILARDIDAAHREQLERGTAELKEVVRGLASERAQGGKP